LHSDSFFTASLYMYLLTYFTVHVVFLCISLVTSHFSSHTSHVPRTQTLHHHFAFHYLAHLTFHLHPLTLWIKSWIDIQC